MSDEITGVGIKRDKVFLLQTAEQWERLSREVGGASILGGF